MCYSQFRLILEWCKNAPNFGVSEETRKQFGAIFQRNILNLAESLYLLERPMHKFASLISIFILLRLSVKGSVNDNVICI